MATKKKTKLSYNAKLFIIVAIVLAAIVIISGSPQAANFFTPTAGRTTPRVQPTNVPTVSRGTVSTISTPFAVDAWGSLGWTNCNNMAGGIAGASSFCKCKGYVGVYNDGLNSCYNEWKNSRWAWTAAGSPACVAQGRATNAGYATTSIKCEGTLLADLKDYPAPFVSAGAYQGIIVVGNEAPASDIIAATDIAFGWKNSINTQTSPTAKLDTEVTAADKTQPLALIGNEGVNRLIADAKGIPYAADHYNSASAQGYGTISLIRSPYTANKAILLVEGAAPSDTRYAANVLKNYGNYKATLFGNYCKAYANGSLSCYYI